MSEVVFTENFTPNEIHKLFEERYVDFEETEIIMDMMENPEIYTAWGNDGGCTVTIHEREEHEKISVPQPR